MINGRGALETRRVVMSLRGARTSALSACTAVALLLAAPAARAAETPCGADATLPGTSDALNKGSFGSYPVGDLSALAADGTARAPALIDDDGSPPAPILGHRLGPTASGGIDAAATFVTRLGDLHRDDFDGESLTLEPDGSARLIGDRAVHPPLLAQRALLNALDIPDRFRVAPAGETTGTRRWKD